MLRECTGRCPRAGKVAERGRIQFEMVCESDPLARFAKAAGGRSHTISHLEQIPQRKLHDPWIV